MFWMRSGWEEVGKVKNRLTTGGSGGAHRPPEGAAWRLGGKGSRTRAPPRTITDA